MLAAAASPGHYNCQHEGQVGVRGAAMVPQRGTLGPVVAEVNRAWLVRYKTQLACLDGVVFPAVCADPAAAPPEGEWPRATYLSCTQARWRPPRRLVDGERLPSYK